MRKFPPCKGGKHAAPAAPLDIISQTVKPEGSPACGGARGCTSTLSLKHVKELITEEKQQGSFKTELTPKSLICSNIHLTAASRRIWILHVCKDMIEPDSQVVFLTAQNNPP